MRALVRERGRFLLYLWHHITDLSSFLSVMHNIKRSGRSAPLPLCCFFSFVASICPLPRNLEHIALRHTNVLGVRSLMISYITSSSSLPRLDNTQRAAILKRDHVPPPVSISQNCWLSIKKCSQANMYFHLIYNTQNTLAYRRVPTSICTHGFPH